MLESKEREGYIIIRLWDDAVFSTKQVTVDASRSTFYSTEATSVNYTKSNVKREELLVQEM